MEIEWKEPEELESLALRIIKKHQPTALEKPQAINTNVVEQTAPVVNPLDELGAAVEEFKLKIKAMFEESTALSRKLHSH
ncbi:MAG: hypothetical protein E7050_10225 [Lentisphaerae bacterium]|nr:hypothetical protein [Lentisphaerota bacterium]